MTAGSVGHCIVFNRILIIQLSIQSTPCFSPTSWCITPPAHCCLLPPPPLELSVSPWDSLGQGDSDSGEHKSQVNCWQSASIVASPNSDLTRLPPGMQTRHCWEKIGTKCDYYIYCCYSSYIHFLGPGRSIKELNPNFSSAQLSLSEWWREAAV